MVSNSIVTFTISLFFFICQTGGLQISSPLRRDLNQLNKPIFKTITTKYGDIFDCYDIHKQPSLDHPLLQNHTLQVKPSLTLEASSSLSPNGSAYHDDNLQFDLEDGGCPEGSVPIRRVQEHDVNRSRAYLQEYPSALSPDSVKLPGWHFAAAQTKRMKIPFHAGRGLFNIYKPSPVSGQQHSDSLLSILSGRFETRNIIQAGWTVNPKWYGDSLVRFHTTWTADNYKKTGCINVHCHGFVQVSRNLAPGSVINPVSQYGGSQFQIQVAIAHDQFSGNWWLIASKNVMVGYWPEEIFTGLKGYAEEVAWGGRAFSPVGTPSPPMGSGHKPGEGFGKSCEVREMQFMRPKRGVYEDLNANMMLLHANMMRSCIWIPMIELILYLEGLVASVASENEIM